MKALVRKTGTGKTDYMISFLLAGMIQYAAFVVAKVMPPWGEYCSVYSDTMSEIVPFIKMFFRHLFQGEYLFYSWETSLGQNTSLIYSFCAYSPFNLIYLIVEDLHIATMLSLVLRVAVSALFFHLFLNSVFGEDKKWHTLLSVCYALCGYQQEYMLSANMMEGVWLLPLVMFSLYRAFRKQKFGLLTVIYAYSFVVNFYMGFLTGVFSFTAGLAYLVLRDGKVFWKKWKGFLLRYFFSVGTAVLISMITILPALAFLGYAGDFDNVYTRYIPDLAEVLHSLYAGNDLFLDAHLPFLYCGWPVLFMVPLYFADASFPAKERITYGIGFLFFFISIWVDPVYYLVHMFNRPDGLLYRQAFLLVFLMVWVAAKELKQGKLWKQGKTVRWYYAAHFLICILVCVLYKRFRREENFGDMVFRTILNTALMVLWGILLALAIQKRRVVIAAHTIIVLEMGFAAWNAGKNYADESRETVKQQTDKLHGYAEYIREAEKRGEIARASFSADTWGYDHSAQEGYPGIGQFSTAKYTGLYRLMSALGDGVSNVRYTQAGATDLTDMVFGVRYRSGASRGEGVSEPEKYEYALPIGYLTSPDILQDIRFEKDVFTNQNRLLSALSGEQNPVYVRTQAWDQLCSGMTYALDENGEYYMQRLSDAERALLLFGVPEESYEHAYFYFQLTGDDTDAQESEVTEDMATDISLFSEADRRSSGKRFQLIFDNAITEMTRSEGMFQILVEIEDTSDKRFTYHDNLFYYQDDEQLKKAFEILQRGGWVVRTWENGRVAADVSVSDDKTVLFMTIPYDPGWTAKVDGIETEILPAVNEVFMALPLTEGEHTIELEYEAPGEFWGRMLFLLGAGLFITGMVFDKRSRSLMSGGAENDGKGCYIENRE